MITELKYRQSSIADFQQLKSLGIESYTEFSKVLTEENWAKMNSFLQSDQNLTNLINQSNVFVCEHKAEIVGMIYLVPSGNPTKFFKKEWSYIRFLGVHTKYRGFGIGKKLTEMCMAAAKKNKEKHIALHSSEFMHSARAIYEKRGFNIVKEIEYLGKQYYIYVLSLE